jgi:hypothetical protein
MLILLGSLSRPSTGGSHLWVRAGLLIGVANSAVTRRCGEKGRPYA